MLIANSYQDSDEDFLMFSVIKTGMATALHELKVISNNISNANSTAYKKSSVSFSELFNGRTADAVESSLLGKGSNVEETRRSDGQGSLISKGGVLDLALVGNGYFVTKKNNDLSFGATRNGAISLDANGFLKSSNGGFLMGAVAVDDAFVDTPVANVDVFQSIRIPFDEYEGPLSNLSVEDNGNVTATFGNDKVALATIGLVSFSNPNGLKQKADGTFGVTEKSGQISVGNPGSLGFASIKSGHIEGSNVDVTEEMTNMIKAQQQFNGAARMMQANSDMIEKLTR